MFAELPRVRSERHIVILISDGLDNSSRAKVSAIINEAIDKRVSFYVIHLPLFEPRDGRLAVRGSDFRISRSRRENWREIFFDSRCQVGAGK